MKKFLLSTLVLVLTSFALFAQVTTGSLTGTIKDSKETLIGATVKATHQPSGTVYATSTKADGKFAVLNMRVGGPYLIEVSYVGYQPQKFENITVKLGEPFVLNVTLAETGTALREVSITAADPNSVLNADKKGATTNLSRAMITSLPSITRSVNDLTRLTPQANGTSVGGGNYRSNNFTVDGSNFNNQFGIGQNIPANGSPISLDALEQISINVTPFDVRQSGFVGGAINAVTRSGTNSFTGSAFYLGRSENQQGADVGDFRINKLFYQQRQYGVSIGGPIVKNKLFFFANGEWNKITQPGQTKVAATSTAAYGTNTNIARPTETFLNDVKSYLISKYNYDPGVYQGYDNKSNNDKFLARIDWNISDKHHFNIRYNQVESKAPSFTSNSTITGVTYTNTRSSNFSLGFSKANYYQDQNLYSLAAELNSTLGSFSNTLRGSRTHQYDPRSSESSVFPFVDILDSNSPLTTFGYELFTYGNLRDVTTFSYTDELSRQFGKHSLTLGAQAEFSTTKNGFQRFGTSAYTYASWTDFTAGNKPSAFAITYPLTADGSQAYPSFKFAQYSLYLQDAFAISDKLSVTGGVRLERPTYPDVSEVQTHPLVASLSFYGGRKVDTGVLPSSKIIVSPRIGFNWDALGDRSLQVRGGTGIFTGRVPFVWIVAQSGDAGMLQATTVYSTPAAVPSTITFNPDPKAYIPTSKPTPGTTIASSPISAMSPNLRFPQTWKSSLAVDVKLPWNVTGTVEGIYNKDRFAAVAKNVNLVTPTPLNVSGYPDSRPIFPNATVDKFINKLDAGGLPSFTATNPLDVTVMENAKGGHYWSVTGQLNKQFGRGLFANVAYTKSGAKNYGDGAGDQLINLWSIPYTSGNSNIPSLGYTANVIPDRLIATVSYKKDYLKNLSTTLSFFYEGSRASSTNNSRFSYFYSSDFNRDRQTNDLIYIPRDPSEITFVAIPAGTSGYKTAYTAQEQSDIFFAYIEQDEYLRNHKGQYAERNGAKYPWRSQVDFRLSQDVYKAFGKDGKLKNTLQFTADIFNLGNLLKSDWGTFKFVNNTAILVPQNVSSLVAGGTVKPTFRMAAANGDIVRSTFSTTQTITSTYFMQFGIRYSFN